MTAVRRPPAAGLVQRALPAVLVVALAGCQVSATASPPQATEIAPTTTPAATAAMPSFAPSPALTAAPADLSARPLAWFAPMPPMPTGPGREYTGSDDFMQLFPAGAAWPGAASHLGVFKLYGEWVAYHATPMQLRAAIDGIPSRGLALAVEMGPLDPPADCGNGIESFAGLDEAALISSRIRSAGGTLQVIALDEPWYFAHVYAGPQACSWSVADVAARVAGFTAAMRREWPGIVVGDTEPTPAPVSVSGLVDWLRAYRDAAGEPLAFLHLDADWTRDWVPFAHDLASGAHGESVPFGLIVNGGSAQSDASWLELTGRRLLAYEDEARSAPDHIIFQSWMDKPDRVLPEADPLTFTALVERWATDPTALGDPLGAVANLALDRTATASSSVPDARPGRAVDGIADTIWSAGGGPPAYLEIDLGAVLAIGEIRLLVAQSPAGTTHHRVTCRTTAGGTAKVLGDLTSATADLDQLILPVAPSVTCRFVRVRTIESPSWVAWREIEVYAPP
jgi:hypothetical protein